MMEKNEQKCNYGPCENCGKIDYVFDGLCKKCLNSHHQEQLLELANYTKSNKDKLLKARLQKALNTINQYTSMLEIAKTNNDYINILNRHNITSETVNRYCDIINMAMNHESFTNIGAKYGTSKKNILRIINNLVKQNENLVFFGPCQICGKTTFLIKGLCKGCYDEYRRELFRNYKQLEEKWQKALHTINLYNELLKLARTNKTYTNILIRNRISQERTNRYYSIIKMAMDHKSSDSISKKYKLSTQSLYHLITRLANSDGNVNFYGQCKKCGETTFLIKGLCEGCYDKQRRQQLLEIKYHKKRNVKLQKALHTIARYDSIAKMAVTNSSYANIMKRRHMTQDIINRYRDVVTMAAHETYTKVGEKFGMTKQGIDFMISKLARRDDFVKDLLSNKKIEQIYSIEDKYVRGTKIAEMERIAATNSYTLDLDYVIECSQSSLSEQYGPTILKIEGMPFSELIEPNNWLVNQDGIFNIKYGLTKICNQPIVITQDIKYFNKKKTKQYEVLVLVYSCDGIWKTCEIKKDAYFEHHGTAYFKKHNIDCSCGKMLMQYIDDFVKENNILPKEIILSKFS